MIVILNNKKISSLAFLILFLFVALSAIFFKIEGIGLNQSLIFSQKDHYNFLTYFLEIIYLITSIFLLFFVPGLLGNCIISTKEKDPLAFFTYSFIYSIFFLLGIKLLSDIINQNIFKKTVFASILVTLILIASIFVYYRKSTFSLKLNLNKFLSVVIILLLLLGMIFFWYFQDRIIWYKQDKLSQYSIENFEDVSGEVGDVLERFTLEESLKNKAFPFWKLAETKTSGYIIEDPPLHYFILFFPMLLLGKSYGVFNLVNLFFFGITFFFVHRISKLNSSKQTPLYFVLISFLFFLAFILQVVFFHKHYDPAIFLDHYFLMSFFVIGSFYFLLNKKYKIFLILSILAFITKYEAIFFTLASLFFYGIIFTKKEESKNILKKYILFIFFYFLIINFIGIITNNFDLYLKVFFLKKFARLDHLGLVRTIYPDSSSNYLFSWSGVWQLVKTFLYSTCFLGVFLFIPKRDKILKFFSYIGISYFFLICVIKLSRVYYIIPLIYISGIIILRIIFLLRCNRQNK